MNDITLIWGRRAWSILQIHDGTYPKREPKLYASRDLLAFNDWFVNRSFGWLMIPSKFQARTCLLINKVPFSDQVNHMDSVIHCHMLILFSSHIQTWKITHIFGMKHFMLTYLFLCLCFSLLNYAHGSNDGNKYKHEQFC